MQQIKMIGLDLDGTLLNTKKELTENTRRVLREAIDAGILVLMATGRPYTGIPAELRNFREFTTLSPPTEPESLIQTIINFLSSSFFLWKVQKKLSVSLKNMIL